MNSELRVFVDDAFCLALRHCVCNEEENKLLRAISVVPIFARGCNALREMLRRVVIMRACLDAASVGSSTGGLAE